MINLKHINIFKKYDGNGDAFGWTSTKEEQDMMKNNEWSLIESLIRDMRIIKKGLGSQGFEKNVTDNLRKTCDSKETIEELKRLAK